MKRRNTIKRSGLRKRRAGKSAHSYGKLETKRCLASVGLDVAQTCDIDDAPAMVEQAVSENAIEVQSETPLRDRVVERLGDRGPRAEIRERVRTELAERGRDGSNMDPERQERREDRREQRDSDVDSQRREQLRERISARRAASGAFGRFLRR